MKKKKLNFIAAGLIRIDKKIRLPQEKMRYPLNKMNKGDSFEYAKNERMKVAGCMVAYQKATKTKFKTHHLPDKSRIWRIK